MKNNFLIEIFQYKMNTENGKIKFKKKVKIFGGWYQQEIPLQVRVDYRALK